MENSWTPINSDEETALNHLKQYVDTIADGENLTPEDAIANLMKQGIERADARDRIQQLLLKGYLYKVDNKLRIPPRL